MTTSSPRRPVNPPARRSSINTLRRIGGAQKLAGVTSFIATGTSLATKASAAAAAFQIFAKAPDQRTTTITFKDHPERGDSTRTYNGKTGWVKQPRAAVAEYEYTGSELDGVRMDALMLFPGNLKTDPQGPAHQHCRSRRSEMPRSCRAAAPAAFSLPCTSTRRPTCCSADVRFSKTPAGRVPMQIDYDDYRDVNGVKFPFKYTFSWLDGKDTFEIKDVKTNVAIDPAIFGKPK